MATSQKQIEANRKNAQKSTGPKTKAGKAKSSKNATRHGLYAKDIVIDSPHLKEDPTAYDALLQSLTTELKPAGHFQLHLVQTIADCLWRSHRAARAETDRIIRRQDDIDDDLKIITEFNRLMGKKALNKNERKKLRQYLRRILSRPSKKTRNTLRYYETHLERRMQRAYELLTRLQTGHEKN